MENLAAWGKSPQHDSPGRGILRLTCFRLREASAPARVAASIAAA